jgi:hypothetical protein
MIDHETVLKVEIVGGGGELVAKEKNGRCGLRRAGKIKSPQHGRIFFSPSTFYNRGSKKMEDYPDSFSRGKGNRVGESRYRMVPNLLALLEG